MTKTPLLPGQIPPGGFHTRLPYMHQGVEERGLSGLPPPMINTVASDRVAQLGRNGPAPMTAAVPAPPSMMMAPVQSRQAPVNPLGGMDSRPLSARSGGPMSYAPKGVGTNNPNSYAVGRNNKGFAMRTGQPPPGMMQPGPAGSMMLLGPSGQRMLGGPPPPMMTAPGQGSMGQAPAPMMPAPGAGRDDAFWNQMSSDTTAFLGEQQKLGMDMQMADQTAAAKIEERAQNTAQEIMGEMRKTARARETYMIPDPITGQMSPTHFGMNGMALPSAAGAPAPMTADDVAAARAMGGDVRMQMGDAQVSFPGQGPAAKPAKPNISWQTSEDGKSKVPYETVTDPKTGQTVLRRVKIVDENGDGIDDRQQPAVTANGQTGLGHTYTFKQ